ncbi:putative ankyrin repeat-containing domain-containing protein [Helianthus anomalus]
MVKLQRMMLSELSVREAELLYRVANRLDNSVDIVSLLLGAGLKVEGTSLEEVEECRWTEKGWSELHVAVAFDQTDECKDRDGRTSLYLAASKGYERCVKVLAGAGANVDARRNDGCTALYRAALKGNRRMVKVLIDLGADPSIVADDRHCSAINFARDEGYNEIVETLERGKDVLNVARRGDIIRLESLLERDATKQHPFHPKTTVRRCSSHCCSDMLYLYPNLCAESTTSSLKSRIKL